MSSPPPIAVIGCGQWGRNHVRTLAELGALAAVCDHTPAKAAALVDAHGGRVASFDEIIADPQVAGIVLALPAEQNAELACAALKSGKHVLVEKPIALTGDDAARMVETARTAGRVLMVGHILRYHAAFASLVDALTAGRIGALKHIQSHRLGFGKFYERFDALWDLAPHDLSLVLSLVDGVPERVRVEPVSVTGGQADLAHMHLDFAGGRSAHVFVSRHSAYPERRLTVTGETGTLVWDDLADWPDKLSLVPHKVVRDGNGRWQWSQGEAEAITVEPGMALTNQLRHFLECAAGHAQPLTPGTQGLAVVRILEAGRG